VNTLGHAPYLDGDDLAAFAWLQELLVIRGTIFWQ